MTTKAKLITKITDDKGLNGGRSATGIGTDGKKYRVCINATGKRVLLNGGRFGHKYGMQWMAHRLCLESGDQRWETIGKVPRSYSLKRLLVIETT